MVELVHLRNYSQRNFLIDILVLINNETGEMLLKQLSVNSVDELIDKTVPSSIRMQNTNCIYRKRE